MDDLTRHFYELSYRVAFLERGGDAFQGFFSDIMEKCHPGDFQRVRPWGRQGDRKNDGYLKSQRMLFQCYAPNELSAEAAIKKIDEDFGGALPYWKEHFDTWVFVHNSRSGLGPEVLKRLLELASESNGPTLTHWGFEELRRKLFELSETDLAALFGPMPTLEVMMDLGLADLQPVIEQIQLFPPAHSEQIRPVPPDKLEYNQLSNDTEHLLRIGMSRETLVAHYFTRASQLQDRLAASFRLEYERLRDTPLSPDLVFAHLQRFAGGTEVTTPRRQAAVLAVLAYFFEKCDIFDSPLMHGEEAP